MHHGESPIVMCLQIITKYILEPHFLHFKILLAYFLIFILSINLEVDFLSSLLEVHVIWSRGGKNVQKTRQFLSEHPRVNLKRFVALIIVQMILVHDKNFCINPTIHAQQSNYNGTPIIIQSIWVE